ncbi:hypothetical protein DL93DRAFT_2095622 [Clavulina sp. PMI_390]|nr:hypothetical protein DL93DRAFT_2095622 [Clavulina sp. PMI_390]
METRNPENQQSVVDLRVSTVSLFAQVIDFGRLVCAKKSRDLEHDYALLKEQIASFESLVPGLSDSLEFRPFEAVSTSRPHIFLAHITMYGSGMVLHSLQASKNPEARRDMLKNLQSLIDICKESRGPQRLKSVQAGLPSMHGFSDAPPRTVDTPTPLADVITSTWTLGFDLDFWYAAREARAGLALRLI